MSGLRGGFYDEAQLDWLDDLEAGKLTPVPMEGYATNTRGIGRRTWAGRHLETLPLDVQAWFRVKGTRHRNAPGHIWLSIKEKSRSFTMCEIFSTTQREISTGNEHLAKSRVSAGHRCCYCLIAGGRFAGDMLRGVL